jgi:hypothetical protein
LVGAYYFTQDIKIRDVTFLAPDGGRLRWRHHQHTHRSRTGPCSACSRADIMDNLTVTGELRYAVEEKTLIDRVSATTQFCAGEAGQAARFGFTGTCRPAGKWKSWTPRVTVDYSQAPTRSSMPPMRKA